MKVKDFIWIAAVLCFLALMLVPPVSEYYNWLNGNMPYIAGFIKFFVLATLGDMLSMRILNKKWVKIPGIMWRALVYGFIGMLITLVFGLFGGGVVVVMEKGLLPFSGNRFFTAFFTALLMNFFFAPVFMAFHRVTDTLIDMRCGEKLPKVMLRDALLRINFVEFYSFVVIKTIPLFWVPAHTVTFLLPEEYRVLAAAVLSIAMGAILTFAKTRKPSGAKASET